MKKNVDHGKNIHPSIMERKFKKITLKTNYLLTFYTIEIKYTHAEIARV